MNLEGTKWWWRMVHFFASFQGGMGVDDELTKVSRIKGWPSEIDIDHERYTAVRTARERGWLLSREGDEIVAVSSEVRQAVAEESNERILWAIAAHNSQLLPDLTRA